LAVTTIRVVGRANTFTAEGAMLKGMSMSKMGARRKVKLHGIVIKAKGTELSKAMGGIGWRAHQAP
jgi:hypothetical protein